MIRYVFWDLGDTVLNEDRLRCAIYLQLHRQIAEREPGFTFDEMLREREALIAGGDTRAHYGIARRHLPDGTFAGWRRETLKFVAGEGQQFIMPVRGAVETFDALRDLHHGIIADQPASVLETLDSCGLGGRFTTEAVSSIVGANKPDEAIFRWALDHAGASAAESVMIGNRLDVDVRPARRLGMRTILCYLSPESKGWDPPAEAERAYLASLGRVHNWRTVPQDAEETPDAVVRALPEIPSIIGNWG